jgi:hypothetical protein
MRIFVQYYYNFKKLNQSATSNQDVASILDENFTHKSKISRTSKAKRIFREGLEIDALNIILESDNPQVEPLKDSARKILNKELGLD